MSLENRHDLSTLVGGISGLIITYTPQVQRFISHFRSSGETFLETLNNEDIDSFSRLSGYSGIFWVSLAGCALGMLAGRGVESLYKKIVKKI